MSLSRLPMSRLPTPRLWSAQMTLSGLPLSCLPIQPLALASLVSMEVLLQAMSSWLTTATLVVVELVALWASELRGHLLKMPNRQDV